MSKTLFTAVAVITLVAGCDTPPELAPVAGTVTLNGKPLQFGFVVFQPDVGPPAQGAIADGGSFSLETDKLGPGALLGNHRVSVYCYEGHRPGSTQQFGDVSLGRSLIPEHYTRGGMSGLSADVPPEGLTDYKIELVSKGSAR